MALLGPLFRWDAVDQFFSDRARLQGMLDFESALARAEASSGVIPASAAPAIADKCRAELFDASAIARATAPAGSPAIPLVKNLTALVSKDAPDAARFVHWGATSQDAIDSGFVLQARRALDAISSETDRLAASLADLARKYRDTPVAARTWMQQALPTSFGLIAAGWLDAVDRHALRLQEVRRRALVLQFGGAVGTLAALGNKGLDVAKALGAELDLPVPDLPWHSHRDRMAELAATLALLAGTLGKIGRDISLHMQTEVAEVFEPAGEGRGGSSTMPHKRNPVASAVALAGALRVPGLVATMLSAMVEEQERGIGGWHAEWETLPEIFSLSAGALHHLTNAVASLELDPMKMAENLELTRGLIFAEAVQMALGPVLGRLPAHDLVQAAAKRALAEKRSLQDVLATDPQVTRHLPPAELARLFDPHQYLGASQAMIDRVLGAHAARQKKSSAGGN